MLFRWLSPNSGIKYPVFAVFITLAAIAPLATYYARYGRATTVTFTNSDATKASMDIDMLRGVELREVRSGQRSGLPLDRSSYTVVVFLSGGDCPNMLNERAVWSDLVSEYSEDELLVVGLLVRTSVTEANTFLEGFDLPFTVFVDERNELRKLTKVPSTTPFKLLLHDGEVVITEGPKTLAPGRQTFADKVRAITGRSASNFKL